MALYNITTKQEFDAKVLKNDNLVLVDFWAEWCPPCRAMEPILKSLADSREQFDVVKVDVEASADNSRLATEHGVQGIPNMQVYKDGKMVKELIGMRPRAVLEQELAAV